MHDNPRACAARGAQHLRFETPLEVAVMLLFVSNVVFAQHASATPTSGQAATAMPRPNCTHVGPVTLPDVLRDAGHFLRRPVDSAFEMGRYIYYHTQGNGCVPPQSPTEEVILQLADTGVSLLETALLGPEASVIPAVGSGLEAAGDAAGGVSPSRSVLQDLLLSMVGLKTGRFEPPAVEPPPLTQLPPWDPGLTSIPLFGRAAQAITRRPALDPTRVEIGAVNHEGVYPYRDTVSGREGRAVQVNGEYFRLHAFTGDGAVVEGVSLIFHDGHYRLRVDEPAQEGAVGNDEPGLTARVRCRRMPGAACSTNAPYSPALNDVLLSHFERGIPEELARNRGIVADPLRPGWFVRVSRNLRRQYLRIERRVEERGEQRREARYFPVKLRRPGGCSRLTVYTARGGLLGGVAPRRLRSGPALVDIAESPLPTGPRLITQTEFNLRHRAFLSEDASLVYEHAVRTASRVQLIPEERSAVLRYYGDAERNLDAYLQQEVRDQQPLYVQQEQTALAVNLQSALRRMPGYAGTVYRGAMLSSAVVGDLEPGQTVRIRTFVRASGERGMALHQLEGRDVPDGQTPVLLNLQMETGAHAVGLTTLRDEAEVIIDSGRIFVVVEVRPGELLLREAGLARQAFGQGGAVTLRLG